MNRQLTPRRQIVRLEGFLPRPVPCGSTPRHTSTGVSVIIPAFNAAQTLHDAITSVLRQTQPPDEIVVLDDASTDQTFQVAEQFAYTGIRLVLVRFSQQRGAAAARNEAIRRASGQVLIFQDADDIAPPDRIEVTRNEFASSQAHVVYGQKEFFERDRSDRTAAPKAALPSPRTVVGATGYGTQALACKREVFVEYGCWFDESMVVAEDAEHLVACLSQNLRVHCSPYVVVWQRRTPGSLRDRGDWNLMRGWIRVKHRAWLQGYGAKGPDDETIATVMAARRAAGWVE